jgi:hypothetical protein
MLFTIFVEEDDEIRLDRDLLPTIVPGGEFDFWGGEGSPQYHVIYLNTSRNQNIKIKTCP